MADYSLGVDLGTTFTAAATATGGHVAAAPLSQRATAIATVVHVAADGAVLIGDAAVRRAIGEPDRVAREMKRRIGDPVPMLVGGAPWSPEALQARVLRWVVDHVTAEHGAPPQAIVVTHPANWAAFKLDLLAQAARQVGLPDVVLRPEPVAAAAWYATEHRLDDGAAVAVYDLGGGTFDAAVVRRQGTGFELLGRPDGVERLGGIDFDAAVLGHVTRELGDVWTSLDPTDPDVLQDVADLRERCTEAKEALSVDTAATIPVRLPAVRTSVRLTREELEAALRGPLGETITALRRTIDSAGLEPRDLAAVLLVGGSSRIPLVAELVSAELGIPVAVDANPKLAVALGAARLADAEEPSHAPAPAPAPLVEPAPPTSPPPPVEESVPTVPLEPASAPPSRRRRLLLLAGAGVAIIAIVASALALRGDGDNDGGDASGSGGELGADGVLRLGLLLPETGSLDFVAPGMRAGAEQAVEDVNAHGGVHGTDVELVVADSGEPGSGTAEAAVASLLDQGVDAVIGPPSALDTGVVPAVAGASRAGCSAIDTSVDSLDDDDGTFAQIVPSQLLQAEAIAQAIEADGNTLASILFPSDLSTFAGAVIDALDTLGIEIEANVEYERGSLDVVGALGELRNTASGAAVLLGDEGELAALINEGASEGDYGPFYGDETFELDSFGNRIAPTLAEASTTVVAITTAPWPTGDDDSALTRIQERLTDSGAEPFAATYVYDCVLLAAVAAEAGGSDTPGAIIGLAIDTTRSGQQCVMTDCLDLARDGVDIDYVGASGPVDLDDDGRVTTGRYDRWHWDASGTKVEDTSIDV